jgi:hypothetical protein
MLTPIFVSYMFLAAPAVAVNVTGTAAVDLGTGRTPLKRFDAVPETATVFTMPKSFVQIRLASGTLLRLGPETTVKLTALEHGAQRGKRKESVKLVVGRLWARVTNLFGDDSKFEVDGSNAVAGVRGTYLMATVDDVGASSFYTISGSVSVTDPSGQALLLESGMGVTATPEGLGPATPISPAELASLVSAIAGPTGALQTELLAVPGALTGTPIAFTPDFLRNELVGPDQIVDTVLQSGGAGSAGTEPNSVDVRVQVQVPTR